MAQPPGILTGTIIGLAQALGETAPLLLIGMNAFVTAAPGSPSDASTVLPTQTFIWADGPERGFVWTREQLLDRVWGRDIYVDTRTIDVHVGRLRKALMQNGGDNPVRTVRGTGYALG